MTCNVNSQLKIALFGNHFPSPKCEKKMLFTFYILQFKLYNNSRPLNICVSFTMHICDWNDFSINRLSILNV